MYITELSKWVNTVKIMWARLSHCFQVRNQKNPLELTLWCWIRTGGIRINSWFLAWKERKGRKKEKGEKEEERKRKRNGCRYVFKYTFIFIIFSSVSWKGLEVNMPPSKWAYLALLSWFLNTIKHQKRTGDWLIWGLGLGKYNMGLEYLMPANKCSKNDQDTYPLQNKNFHLRGSHWPNLRKF